MYPEAVTLKVMGFVEVAKIPALPEASVTKDVPLIIAPATGSKSDFIGSKPKTVTVLVLFTVGVVLEMLIFNGCYMMMI